MEKYDRYALHEEFFQLVVLSEKLKKYPRTFGADEQLRSAEIHLIELIGDNQGMSVTGLAKLREVTKGAVSQNLKRLERKGFTQKQDDPANNSRSIVSLTGKGKISYDVHKAWHESMDGGFKKYLSTLEEENIKFLFEFMDKVEDFFKRGICGD
jgi:DNA-binding MarR family transcriptional regulator